MGLPVNDLVWPPDSVKPMLSKMSEWAAWYSGETSRIMDVYASQQNATATIPWYRFWNRARAGRDGAQRAELHVPVASDLAAVSGSLLFGEPPKIRVRAARTADQEAQEAAAVGGPDANALPEEGGAKPVPGTPPDDAAQDPSAPPAFEIGKPAPKVEVKAGPEAETEKRLLQMIEEGDVYSRLVEAAETAAAIGGVYIYPVWDKDLRDFPIMAVAQADQAVPEFKWGMLTRVTFHRVVAGQGNEMYRHIEVHEVEGTGESRKAVVLNALYKGSDNRLGGQVPLDTLSQTANIMPRVELPFKELDVEYVPNIRPNRLWRASGHGVADIQGAESLLDALDETFASWMRDIRLAKARILVPREYLRNDADGTPAFDIDQEIYVGMDMEPGLAQDARAMLAHQFQIRHEEHRATAEALIQRIVSNAGYTPTTLDATELAGQSSASALRVGDHKTLLTLRKKSGWWRTAIANVLFRMQQIDVKEFGQSYEPIRPVVITADSIIDNPLELAQTALAMKTAESASIETRVRLLHADWSEAEVDAEVLRIQGDLEAAKPPPPVIGAPGDGSFGNSEDDPASTQKKPVTAPTRGAPPNAPPPNPGKKP